MPFVSFFSHTPSFILPYTPPHHLILFWSLLYLFVALYSISPSLEDSLLPTGPFLATYILCLFVLKCMCQNLKTNMDIKETSYNICPFGCRLHYGWTIMSVVRCKVAWVYSWDSYSWIDRSWETKPIRKAFCHRIAMWILSLNSHKKTGIPP